MSDDDIKFFTAKPSTSNPDAYHFYEEDTDGMAAVYVKGKAYCAGHWYEVVRELLSRVGVQVLKVEPENLWLNTADENSFEIYPEEVMLDPVQRVKRMKERRIGELQRELEALTGKSVTLTTEPDADVKTVNVSSPGSDAQ